MKEYIEREAARRAIEHADPAFCYVLDYVPSEKVEKVNHGEWRTIRETDDSKTTECSNCRESFHFMKKGQLNIDLMPRCPICGAKMDGKQEE